MSIGKRNSQLYISRLASLSTKFCCCCFFSVALFEMDTLVLMYQAVRSDLNSVSASFSGVGITPSVALKELNQLSVNIFISFYFLSLLLWLALPHIQWKCETDNSFFETLVRNISICSTPFKLCSEIQNLYRFGAGVCVCVFSNKLNGILLLCIAKNLL